MTDAFMGLQMRTLGIFPSARLLAATMIARPLSPDGAIADAIQEAVEARDLARLRYTLQLTLDDNIGHPTWQGWCRDLISMIEEGGGGLTSSS